jgi:hypothetical protein
MKEALAEYTDPETNIMELHCSMTVMSGELAVFLGHQNVDFLAILTNLYDSEDEWEYRTKHQGQEKIKGVCLNFLGGTAPDWIKSMIPEAALGGGFTSRIIWIVEWDKGKIIADPTPTPRMYNLRKLLIEDLERISVLTGEMKREEQALEFYEEWYVKQTKSPPFTSGKFDGYCARRATHVQKLAMIMSAARSNELVVRLEDLKRAIYILEAAEVTMPDAFTGLGKAQYMDISELVLGYMMNAQRPVKHSELLRVFFPDVSDYVLTVAMETLISMRALEISTILPRGDKEYALNPDYVQTDRRPKNV